MKKMLIAGAAIGLIGAAGWFFTGPALAKFAIVITEKPDQPGPGLEALETLGLTILCGLLLLVGSLIFAVGLARALVSQQLSFAGRLLLFLSAVTACVGGSLIFYSVRQCYQVLVVLATSVTSPSADSVIDGLKSPEWHQTLAAILLLAAAVIGLAASAIGFRSGESQAEGIKTVVMRIMIGFVVIVGILAVGVWLTMLPNAWTLSTLLSSPPAQGVNPSEFADQILAVYNKSLFFSSSVALVNFASAIAAWLIAKPQSAQG